jgi:ankyrin repeat protein
MNPLYLFEKAIESGDANMVKFLIDQKSVGVNAQMPHFQQSPALVFAVKCGCLEIVQFLLQANAEINCCDLDGITPCHAAVFCNNSTEILSLLLRYQPNLHMGERRGLTAIQLSVRVGNHAASVLLIRSGAPLYGVDIFTFACTSTSVINALIDRKIVVAMMAKCGEPTTYRKAATYSLLHGAAAVARDVKVLDMLVNICCIDLETKDSRGSTCLHYAVEHSNMDALYWLLSAGVDVNSQNTYESIPLDVANYECAIALFAAGADAYAPNYKHICLSDQTGNGRSLLHEYANIAKSIGMSGVYALVAGGADLDAPNYFGTTPRMILDNYGLSIDMAQVCKARQDISKARIDIVRRRAVDVCMGLQSLHLPALQTCEILQFSCGPVGTMVSFHQWWNIAITTKHF